MFQTLCLSETTRTNVSAQLHSSDQQCPQGGALTKGEQLPQTAIGSRHIFISTLVPERKQIWHNPEDSTAFSTYSI